MTNANCITGYTPSTITVEICVGSAQDAITAIELGADRIEVNSALTLGGLTPQTSTLHLIRKMATRQVPLICMVRPRAGGFLYEAMEKKEMLEQMKELIQAGADGFAFGALDASYRLDEAIVREMIDFAHAHQKEAVFHRAIDCATDYETTIEQLIAMGIDRILTSGQQLTAIEGASRIAQIQQRYGKHVQILAGSGLHGENVQPFLAKTRICQVHASCQERVQDPTTSTIVDFSQDTTHPQTRMVLSKNKAQRFINAAHKYQEQA